MMPGRIELAICLLALACVPGVISARHPATADAAPAQPWIFVPVSAAWALDARSSLGAIGPVGPNASVHLPIAGIVGAPGTGVAAVLLNFTKADAATSCKIAYCPDETS